MKRLLNCDTSDLAKMNKQEKLTAMEASEGRVLVQEYPYSTTHSCFIR